MDNKSLVEKIEELFSGQQGASFQSSRACSHCAHCRSKGSRKRTRNLLHDNGREDGPSSSSFKKRRMSTKEAPRCSELTDDSESLSDSFDSSCSTSDSDSDVTLTAKEMCKLIQISNKKLLLRLIASNKKLIASNKKVIASNKLLSKTMAKYHKSLPRGTRERSYSSLNASNLNGKCNVPDAEAFESSLEGEEEASLEITPIPEQLLVQETQETRSEDGDGNHFSELVMQGENFDPEEAKRLARFTQAATRARKTKISLFVGDMMNTLYTKEYLVSHCLSGSKTKSSMDPRDVTDIEGFVRRYFPSLCRCTTVNALNCPCFSNEVVKAIKTRFHNSSRLSLAYSNAPTSPCNPNESSSSQNN